MKENMKVLVLFDENEISGVKVGNDIFFRKENEDVEEFFNLRIIPLLSEKGIDFISLYKRKNIIKMKEEDFNLKDSDNVNITVEQKSRIVNALNRSDLDYDEQLYAVRLYEKIFNVKYDYNSPKCFERAKDLVAYSFWRSVDEIKEIDEVKAFISKDLNVVLDEIIDFENLPNPLFENNLIEEIIKSIKNNDLIDIYDILTKRDPGFVSYINKNDMLDYENMNFKILKEMRYMLTKEQSILELPDYPFSDINNIKKDKDKYFEKLYGFNFYYGTMQRELLNGYWNYLPSLIPPKTGDEITHRVYINMPFENMYKFIIMFYERLMDDDISYIAKFSAREQRDDNIVIYSDEENSIKVINIIKDLYKEMPNLFTKEGKNPITSSYVGIPGIGVASEPNVDGTSHNMHLADVIDRVLSVAVLKYIRETNDEKVKGYFINNLSLIIDSFSNEEGTYDKILNNFDKIVDELLKTLDILPPEFDRDAEDYRCKLLVDDVFMGSGNSMFSIREGMLYAAIKDTVKACNNVSRLVDLANEEVVGNAKMYDVDPDNIAFNYYPKQNTKVR